MDRSELKTCHFTFEGVEFDFLIDKTEQIITQNVEKTGAWEQNQLSLYRRFIPDNGVFVDVGANVGVNSIFAKKRVPSARVISIEASENNFDILRDNADGTGIETHFLAIADHDGTIKFAGAGTNAKISEHGVSVPCSTLDSFARGIPNVDLLKIDVEGFTDVVLSGAKDTLQKTNRAIVEFSVGDVRHRFEGNINVEEHFEMLIKQFDFPHVYYISRADGLILLESATDLVEILSIEYNVGDLLFSREPEACISLVGYLLRKTKILMQHNHRALTAIRRIEKRPAKPAPTPRPTPQVPPRKTALQRLLRIFS